MRGQPTEPEAENTSYTHRAANLRQRAVELRAEAGQAREHAADIRAGAEQATERAATAMRSLGLRRLRHARWREEAEFRAEEERGLRELSAYIDGLRREQEMLHDETALEDAWFREQVLQMLEQGWTHEALRAAGFGDAFLAELGLAEHPALRPADPGAEPS